MSVPVSVIVRSVARPTLAAALASLAAQDHAATEVVLVAANGPSHPLPPPRCGAFALRFVSSAVPLTRPLAANAGLDAAQGEYVTFLDDDDELAPDHLSGLVAGLEPGSGVVHSYARARFGDGRVERVGRPASRMQLFERNFIHLSTALVARSLVDEGCRFDPQFEILEDWDWFIALAQRTRFAFARRESFTWNADAGDSGAGGDGNADNARFARFRDLVHAKWRPARDALVDRVAPILESATRAAGQGDLARAQALCGDALAASQNDPWALNLRAMVERATGRLTQARATQELAVEVRPGDADLVYNLALLCRQGGDLPAARKYAKHACALAPEVVRYRDLANALS